MHPRVIARILDLAATKVAASFDHHAVIDQAADALLAKTDQRSFTREVAERIDNRDLVHAIIDQLDTDTIAEKAAEQLQISDQDVIDKAAEQIVESHSPEDVTEAVAERLVKSDKLLDRAATVLVDRVCTALEEQTSAAA